MIYSRLFRKGVYNRVVRIRKQKLPNNIRLILFTERSQTVLLDIIIDRIFFFIIVYSFAIIFLVLLIHLVPITLETEHIFYILLIKMFS